MCFGSIVLFGHRPNGFEFLSKKNGRKVQKEDDRKVWESSRFFLKERNICAEMAAFKQMRVLSLKKEEDDDDDDEEEQEEEEENRLVLLFFHLNTARFSIFHHIKSMI